MSNFTGFHEGPWPEAPLTEHFTWHEAACRCCGRLPASLDAVRNQARLMEKIRATLGDRPVHVHSWFRCPDWNRRVGGVANSQHLAGRATDFNVKSLSARSVQRRLKPYWAGSHLPIKPGEERFIRGLGCYSGFTHADNRPGEPSLWTAG